MKDSGGYLAERIRKRQTSLVRELNDQYIFVQQAIPVLEAQRTELAQSSSEDDRKYVVPSRKKTGVARRTDEEVRRVYDIHVERELYATYLIAAVSRTEAFIFDVLWMILQRYPEKLSLSLQGNRAELNVSLAVLLKADSLGAVKEAMIERRLNGVAYAKPREYLRYFSEVTGIPVDEVEFDEYVEIKATRDLLIHNSGLVNVTYQEKAGALARGKLSKTVPIDRAYYDTSIAVLKKLARHVSDGGWTAFRGSD